MLKKGKELRRNTYFIYGLGVAYFILDQLYNQWAMYYYLPPTSEKNLVPLLKPQYLVIAFVIARLIDAISDPVVGYWSDNSKSKYGKRSFFMGIGALPLGILMILYFYPPKSNQLLTLIYLSIVGGLFFMAYTLVGAPYNALIPDLAKTKNERLTLSTVQSTFRLIFTAFAVIVPGILIKIFGNGNTEIGIRKTIILLTIISISLVYVCIFFLKENQIVENKTNENKKLSFKKSFKYLYDKEIMFYFIALFFFFSGFNVLRSVLTYYLTIVMKSPLSNITLVSAILFGVAGLSFPITKKLGEKYLYKNILIGDILLLVIGTVGLIFVNEKTSYLAYIMFIICGLGLSGAAFIFPQAMLSEITSRLVETKKVSLEGFLFGIQGLFLKLAFLVQQVILALVIVLGSKKAENGLRTATNIGVKLSLIIALIFFVVSLIFYNLKKED